MKLAYTVALVGILVAAGVSAAMAGMSAGYVGQRQQAVHVNAQTIGEQLASGKLTEPQVVQLIHFTGLSLDEARAYTVSEVAAMRWTNN